MLSLPSIRWTKWGLAVLTLTTLLAAGCRNPSPVTLPSTALADADRLLESFRERGAFPGGVLAVGHRGAPVYLHAFGRLTYEADAPPVSTGTLYDLASLTKVVATTTMAMILVDDGRLDLDQPVHQLLPGFEGPGKETHSKGPAGSAGILPAYLLCFWLVGPAGCRRSQQAR